MEKDKDEKDKEEDKEEEESRCVFVVTKVYFLDGSALIILRRLRRLRRRRQKTRFSTPSSSTRDYLYGGR